ncbi:uncharacterized protein LOC135371698 [Ornithodoros turicata]|uniref:uncharacterized protein LOC135371698 n=1 Tax=Ornithodoros turicata TaxID=34597 RepID=UPI003139847F
MKLRAVRRKAKRLQCRVTNLSRRLQSLQARTAAIEESTLESQIADLPQKQKECVRHCVQAAKKSAKGMRYSKEWILECILMKLKSPRLYKHMRRQQILALPSESTLNRYLRRYKTCFGFNEEIMRALKTKTRNMGEFHCHGGILVDEMKLSEHFQVKSSGKIDGFVDLGPFTPEAERRLPCNHGMVIMFAPFVGKWTQILGVFATNSNVKGDLLAKILIEAIIMAENAGLFVDFISCDGATWNRKMWRLFGIGATAKNIRCSSTHPVNPERKLHFISDFPHLIKCLRNRLVQQGFNTPQGRVSV